MSLLALPSNREEDWRWSDLSALPDLAERASTGRAPELLPWIEDAKEGPRLVFVDGALDEAAWTRAASFSYADSRSATAAYFAPIGESAMVWSSSASGDGAMSDWGARMRVQATGVGAPLSDRTVTTASPVPSEVSSSSRSYWLCGYVLTAALSALPSSMARTSLTSATCIAGASA